MIKISIVIRVSTDTIKMSIILRVQLLSDEKVCVVH